MSDELQTRPRQVTQRRRFGIVASQYNADYVRGLVENARTELQTIVPGAAVSIHEVPGAFEIPLMAQAVAARGAVDAILALGVIIRGETEHADLIARTITDSLQRLALKFNLPIIHEVLLLRDEAQAKARCLDGAKNRGVEAARSAVRMVESLAGLRSL